MFWQSVHPNQFIVDEIQYPRNVTDVIVRRIGLTAVYNLKGFPEHRDKRVVVRQPLVQTLVFRRRPHVSNDDKQNKKKL